jgi:hypothetical protein
MTRVAVSPHNVLGFPEGGGHAWVPLQYVYGLRSIGCDVWWLEELEPSGDRGADEDRVRAWLGMLERHGLAGRGAAYVREDGGLRWVVPSRTEAELLIAGTDLLLNFHQRIRQDVVERFRCTALVDIDPGLLQFWMHHGQLSVQPHDIYLTTGETVGTPNSPIPDCGIDWVRVRPPVAIDQWPYCAEPGSTWTTVSGWWAGEWLYDGDDVQDNNKRAAFLRCLDLPSRVSARLELSLNLSDDATDVSDMALLRRHGWSVRHAAHTAGSPEGFRNYVRGSRGEFSCAKQSCIRFSNAWISDRTLCYLASGRPAVVEHTGASAVLPDGEGLVRFHDVNEAAEGLALVESDWQRHSRAARALVEAEFDAGRICADILEASLAPAPASTR